MKALIQFGFLFIAICISGCEPKFVTIDAANETESVQMDTDNEFQNKLFSDDLQKLGLPLKGENVFNPTKINVGDIVQGFVLTEIQFWEGTPDYPFDTVSAKFKGEAVLKGELTLIQKDGEFYFSDWLVFKPDSLSQEKLPISHHESRGSTITFSNQDDAISATDIKPGQTKSVTLKIQDYILNFLPTDAENVVVFTEFYPE